LLNFIRTLNFKKWKLIALKLWCTLFA